MTKAEAIAKGTIKPFRLPPGAERGCPHLFDDCIDGAPEWLNEAYRKRPTIKRLVINAVKHEAKMDQIMWYIAYFFVTGKEPKITRNRPL